MLVSRSLMAFSIARQARSFKPSPLPVVSRWDYWPQCIVSPHTYQSKGSLDTASLSSSVSPAYQHLNILPTMPSVSLW